MNNENQKSIRVQASQVRRNRTTGTFTRRDSSVVNLDFGEAESRIDVHTFNGNLTFN
ncbi:hypothetical protein [Saccharopolyspora sp. NPDC002686]|uniref:hypothetical protein n=1 Tax=Saccharopolyspora sp. NPDC002686 TaxID=3154541 RepID=UPI00331CA734